mmetsp:Transcript_32790/g.37499  ORF Transcript_32790/g.37499 Transcript_32790/m.37499 type:complete len:115 (-) Transcript_32790:900-1244(-)
MMRERQSNINKLSDFMPQSISSFYENRKPANYKMNFNKSSVEVNYQKSMLSESHCKSRDRHLNQNSSKCFRSMNEHINQTEESQNSSLYNAIQKSETFSKKLITAGNESNKSSL